MKALEFLGFVTELYDRRMKPVSDAHGLTAMALSILLFLANNPQYDTATEIVKMRHLTRSHVSTSIRSLAEGGYLRKEYRNGDHRTEHLVLLPPSREIIAEGQKAQAAYMAALADGFTEAELRTVRLYMDRVNANVLRALEEV